ncbi:hypothetical protein BO70DRAFT_201725 [Aspergillus heteromorphus CBS 117.55]|uniref:Uncharacterized protein n=1 Tax=Aspergillus heteromorphus CBS 117.55 TaxID=1448321 RepID=A0A317WPZ7_9EURO|nr:uncharacterized protein BO70DRAFT_201725 [Aspergillus heteromorphus CBS 117.55]PWY87731.1 hypothetical protein BO70DRAFT_201725 [Aspergillus heteromorphus CBS 117.55]
MTGWRQARERERERHQDLPLSCLGCSVKCSSGSATREDNQTFFYFFSLSLSSLPYCLLPAPELGNRYRSLGSIPSVRTTLRASDGCSTMYGVGRKGTGTDKSKLQTGG